MSNSGNLDLIVDCITRRDIARPSPLCNSSIAWLVLLASTLVFHSRCQFRSSQWYNDAIAFWASKTSRTIRYKENWVVFFQWFWHVSHFHEKEGEWGKVSFEEFLYTRGGTFQWIFPLQVSGETFKLWSNDTAK